MRTILIAALVLAGLAYGGEQTPVREKPLPPDVRQGTEAREERKKELLAELAKLQAQIDAVKKELAEIESGRPLPMKAERVEVKILPAKKNDVGGEKEKGVDKSEKMQADRKKFIEGLIQRGVWGKVTSSPGGLPKIWVRPGFYALDFDDKQVFVGVVYAYYFDGKDPLDSVRLIDNNTGKEVGSYNPTLGGLKLK